MGFAHLSTYLSYVFSTEAIDTLPTAAKNLWETMVLYNLIFELLMPVIEWILFDMFMELEILHRDYGQLIDFAKIVMLLPLYIYYGYEMFKTLLK